jgi:uncharacterized protein (TIGR02145 family)
MKYLSFYLFMFLICINIVYAQPQKINYQAVAIDASGLAVKNKVISLRLSILDSSSTGSVLYSETHQPTTDGSGQFSVFLGGGTVVSETFSNIPWGNSKVKFLKTESDFTGGTNYSIMGVSQLVSVPFALTAGSLSDSAKVIAKDGTEWSFIVGPNGPEWQQTSGPGGLKMNYPCPGIPTVNYGGQTYHTVQIGNQCWFQENLNVGTMINGTSNQSDNNILEKYCYNNLPANCDTFGGLYQWAEAVQYENGASNTTSPNPNYIGNVRGICPNSWHLSSDEDWCILSLFLDSTVNCSVIGWSGLYVGSKLKSQESFWNTPNYGILNISGFAGYPSGYRRHTSPFYEIYSRAYFWTSSNSGNMSTDRSIDNLNYGISRQQSSYKRNGFSVRCLKD